MDFNYGGYNHGYVDHNEVQPPDEPSSDSAIFRSVGFLQFRIA
jgi:hypothetical protein